ncbi:hypothetical protein LWF15_20690 [Kineosporia rhizophila]|uniref:hypothetical protein n=1 Tax=Kineosporia rhizophila TaxID=84633 RepID=UPI001E43B0D6|nr:hypothetical protein [Kineosporia rhizophila]MCE0537915.1 hypothetical protein [Kineosporia rhizophila]
MSTQVTTLLAGLLVTGLGVALIVLGSRRPRDTPPAEPSGQPLPDEPGPTGAEARPQPAEATPVLPPADRPEPHGPHGPHEPEQQNDLPEGRPDLLPAPLTVVPTHAFTPVLSSDHEVTAAERRSSQQHLGSDLDADLVEVRKLLERRPPALRGMLIDAGESIVVEELAMVRSYLRGAVAGLDIRLREGPVHDSDPALVACLASGLARLPAHHGPVFHRARRDSIRVDALFPGSLLTEPGFTLTRRDAYPATGMTSGAAISYAIWSETGRCAPLLAGHESTVLFTAAARFRVLAVQQHPGQDDLTVFLAQEPARNSVRKQREHQILEHLRRRAADVGVGPLDGPSPSAVIHPGLDATGRAFTPRTAPAPGVSSPVIPT